MIRKESFIPKYPSLSTKLFEIGLINKCDAIKYKVIYEKWLLEYNIYYKINKRYENKKGNNRQNPKIKQPNSWTQFKR